jgi:hypothetical protein
MERTGRDFNLRYYASMCQERLRKTMNIQEDGDLQEKSASSSATHGLDFSLFRLHGNPLDGLFISVWLVTLQVSEAIR